MFDRRVAKTGGYPRVKNSSKSPEVVQELKAKDQIRIAAGAARATIYISSPAPPFDLHATLRTPHLLS